MSANPHANGGLLRKELKLPDFREYAVEVPARGTAQYENTKPLGEFLRDVMKNNMTSFRVFGPDETASNRLQAVYEASKKTWMAEMLPEDADGGELAPRRPRHGDALRAHVRRLAGGISAHGPAWIFPHLRSLCPCHRFHVQPARQVAGHLQEPRAVARLGGFREHSALVHGLAPGPQRIFPSGSRIHRSGDQQGPIVTRIYLPPDANTLLSVADHCLRSTDYINVIVADKQKHLQFTTIDEAVVHCTKGVGIWARASTDAGEEPDVVLASCGDVATMEALAAAAILREHAPDLKLRFVNVVDLFKLQPASEHPHGSTEREFDSLFTTDKPIIFNFHGYPWLIHKLSYRFKGHENLHVRGYKEKGNINTPLELAMLNETSRFHLVIDVIDRVPKLRTKAAHLKEEMKNAIIDNLRYAHEHGTDRPEVANWTWPY